ncbi:MAG: protein kinase, partial [Acidobacteria bacterium]|nr:protein kinase [Acidobacteriota bacterium]
THYLVMEMVPGDTLAERIQHDGAVPIEEALGICTQIAEALEHAHEKGVIHRDLKPANVKVTPEGKVKVLDFGLAKAFAEPSASDVVDSQSPTLMTASPTMPGVILGTAAYMSPEQARGKAVDKRTDIWAFGCVLYELLTGKQAFQGESVTDILAKILEGTPYWQALPERTPAIIRSLLYRCLQKDVTRRSRDAAEIRLQIEEAQAAPASIVPAATIPARSGWRRAMPLVLASLVVGAIIASIANWSLRPAPTPRPVTRSALTLPATEQLGWRATGQNASLVTLSPDGTHLVYVANQQLYLRPMDSLEASPLSGTEGASGTFFSPDGQWVGFFADGKLKKVSIAGGPPLTLCDTPNPGNASWGPDDTIVFAPNQGSGLFQVPASGGTPQELITLNIEKGENHLEDPLILPDGKAVLFVASIGGGTPAGHQIEVQSLETDERRVLIQGAAQPHYLPTGHLVYTGGGTLLAVPFDLARLEVTGPPVTVLEGVMLLSDGTTQFSVSRSGSLVYVPGFGAGIRGESTLVWVDRQGEVEPLGAPERAYRNLALSPDGRSLAVSITEDPRDVWVFDISRHTLTRLTFEGRNQHPTWTPDGRRIVFSSSRAGGQRNLFWKLADGSSDAERLTTSENIQSPSSWSPDGQFLAFFETHPTNNRDIWVLPIEGERKPRPFLQTPFDEAGAVFSPDGRWLAYMSDESGRLEVYVQPFPGPGGKWQISTDGGEEPVWARNGRELFYRNGDRMMVVEVTTQPTFSAGSPEVLFEGQYQRNSSRVANYNVTPDGQRIVMIQQSGSESAGTQINVVLNWFEELKQRVPTGN